LNSVSSAYPINVGTDGRGGVSSPGFYSGDIDKIAIFGSALEHVQVFALYWQGRGETGADTPTVSPTIIEPTTTPTKRPTASPLTASPTPHPNGPFFIRNPDTGKLMTIDGAGCDDGTNIVLWQNDNTEWQKWVLNHDKTIESLHCPGMVVDFEGSKCGNSASVVLARKNNCLDGQAWTLRQDGVIVNADCDTKAIDISGGLSSSSNGANIILWSVHGAANQLWELVMTVTTPEPTANPTASPATSIPTVNPTTSKPTGHLTSLPTFQPSSTPVARTPTTHPTSAPSVSPTTVRQSKQAKRGQRTPRSVFIRNLNTTKLLTLNGGVCTSGTDIVLWQNSSYDFQKWLVNSDGTLESVPCPGMVIDIEGSSCSGEFLKLYRKVNNLASQVWRLQSDGYLRSITCNIGKVVDIMYSSTSNGAEIIIYDAHGGWNQMWEMVPAF